MGMAVRKLSGRGGRISHVADGSGVGRRVNARGRGWPNAGRCGGVAMMVALAVSSCAGGDAQTAAPAATGTAPGAAASATASPTADELGLWPDDYVLTEGPATAGFTGVPAEMPDVDEDSLLAGLAECLGVPAGDVRNEYEAAAYGHTFVNGANPLTSIQSGAMIVTGEQFARDRALLEHPQFAECEGRLQQEAFVEHGPAGVEFETVSAETLPPPTGAMTYLRIAGRFHSQGATIDVSTDVLFFMVGQVEVSASYTNTEKTPPRERLQQIADQVSEKLRKQQPRSVAGRPADGGPVVNAAGPLAA